MASVERRHGAGGISSDEEHCMYNRNVEDDSKTKKSKRRQKINILSSAGLGYLISDCKVNPTRASKRLVSKFFIYFWCIAVVLSILSLLGVRISPFSSSSQVRAVKTSKRRLTADLEEGDGELSVDAISDAVEATSSSDSSLWSSVLGDILSSTDDTGDAEEKSPDADKDDEIPVQLMAIPVKEGNKLNKKLERELACVELTCVDDCNKKIKPKCAKSKTCRNDRDKICKRRCRKARCEERCKDEPKFGYVEREQRMDKCKEECTGPTAAHNKCIKKCHSQFKPCKSRCHEIASKYPCDNPPVTEPPQDIEDEPEAMSTPAETTSSISSTTQELIEDPEMI